jgi:hypothetical protein
LTRTRTAQSDAFHEEKRFEQPNWEQRRKWLQRFICRKKSHRGRRRLKFGPRYGYRSRIAGFLFILDEDWDALPPGIRADLLEQVRRHSVAVQLMTAASSTRFDPALLQAFQRCAPRFERIFDGMAAQIPRSKTLRGSAMLYTIELGMDYACLLETSPRNRSERLRLKKGTRLQAILKPHVVELKWGPVEVADLFFADGSAARGVPFAVFAFTD